MLLAFMIIAQPLVAQCYNSKRIIYHPPRIVHYPSYHKEVIIHKEPVAIVPGFIFQYVGPAAVGVAPGPQPVIPQQPPPLENDPGPPMAIYAQEPQPQLSKGQLASYAVAALQRNCAKCHTGEGSKGDFVMFQSEGYLSQEASPKLILKEINAKRMPPSYSQFRLSVQEYEAVKRWVESQ